MSDQIYNRFNNRCDKGVEQEGHYTEPNCSATENSSKMTPRCRIKSGSRISPKSRDLFDSQKKGSQPRPRPQTIARTSFCRMSPRGIHAPLPLHNFAFSPLFSIKKNHCFIQICARSYGNSRDIR